MWAYQFLYRWELPRVYVHSLQNQVGKLWGQEKGEQNWGEPGHWPQVLDPRASEMPFLPFCNAEEIRIRKRERNQVYWMRVRFLLDLLVTMEISHRTDLQEGVKRSVCKMGGINTAFNINISLRFLRDTGHYLVLSNKNYSLWRTDNWGYNGQYLIVDILYRQNKKIRDQNSRSFNSNIRSLFCTFTTNLLLRICNQRFCLLHDRADFHIVSST